MIHIGPSVVFDGDLTCEEDVTVEGRLSGHLYVPDAALIVAPSAQLKSTIRAARVTVQGTVEGTISASERIDLTSSARVTGNLRATLVVIADGAQINGRVDMGRRRIAARAVQARASQALRT